MGPPDVSLQRILDELIRDAARLRWSVMVRDGNGQPIVENQADQVCATASIGKLLLLIEVARRLEAGLLTGASRLARRPDLAVADSGIWQHLGSTELRVDDLVVLIGSVSDNLATNVLLHHVGLPAVRELAATLGLENTMLHDLVRDTRGPDDPPDLSSGNADELSLIMFQLGAGTVISAGVSERVLSWLATGADLSMIPARYGLDPLAHAQPDRGLMLWNKTGTDAGVRADVGLVRTGRRSISYAVLAEWNERIDQRDEALHVMHTFGAAVRAHLLAGRSDAD